MKNRTDTLIENLKSTRNADEAFRVMKQIKNEEKKLKRAVREAAQDRKVTWGKLQGLQLKKLTEEELKLKLQLQLLT